MRSRRSPASWSGPVLSKYVWAYTPPLAQAAATAGVYLWRVTGTSFPREFAGTVMVMVGLRFLWGASTT